MNSDKEVIAWLPDRFTNNLISLYFMFPRCFPRFYYLFCDISSNLPSPAVISRAMTRIHSYIRPLCQRISLRFPDTRGNRTITRITSLPKNIDLPELCLMASGDLNALLAIGIGQTASKSTFFIRFFRTLLFLPALNVLQCPF